MKKITMIIPSLLLTSCLFGCNKNPEVDPFVIASEEKFNDAISFKDVKYVQMARQYTTISALTNIIYQEAYFSPTVNNEFTRSMYGGETTDPTEYYFEKTKEDGEDKYYKYEQNSTTKEWEKTDANPGDFKSPTVLGDNIKSILELGNVNYDLIKDKYDKYRQAYYFETTNQQNLPYAVIMSFYNNQLNYFSYAYEKDDKVESSVTSITYGLLTPKLPEVK